MFVANPTQRQGLDEHSLGLTLALVFWYMEQIVRILTNSRE
jgi:hypothetical protein